MENTILGCMSSILEKLKDPDSRRERLIFSEDRFDEIKEETDYLNERMGLSPIQSLLLSALVENATSCKCSLSELASYLGLNYVKLLTYAKDIDYLWDNWFIRRRGSDIRVPADVIDEFSENRPYKKPVTTGLSTKDILSRFEKLFVLRREESITSKQLMRELDEIMYNNPETSVGASVKKYMVDGNKYIYDIDERMMLYLLLYFYDSKNADMISMDDLKDYYDDSEAFIFIQAEFENGDLKLQRNGIIENSFSDGLLAKDLFHIKDSVKKEFLADKGGLHKQSRYVFDMEPERITTKEMFYNNSEKKQIDTLRELLSQEKLSRVYEKMKSKGLRTGFSCLFYGAPGTGKTETVYQLAKETGRKIIITDVSKLKNCFVGETEKNVRSLFRDYSSACSEAEITPILLFNEADAIFGVRKEKARDAVDKMENSVQNIILQEMENLNGILIATTNLTANLDPAFERRFLYKVKFNKPDADVKAQIWRSMLPDIPDSDISELSKKFDFSGGQIENIARKRTIKAILSETEPSYKELESYCLEELIEKESPFKSKIGFV